MYQVLRAEGPRRHCPPTAGLIKKWCLSLAVVCARGQRWARKCLALDSCLLIGSFGRERLRVAVKREPSGVERFSRRTSAAFRRIPSGDSSASSERSRDLFLRGRNPQHYNVSARLSFVYFSHAILIPYHTDCVSVVLF